MNDYEKREEAQKYYAINEGWLSDLAFFATEICFFGELLKKNLVLSPDVKTDDTLHDLRVELLQIQSAMDIVNDDILENMKLLRQALLKSYPLNLDAVNILNDRLSKKVTGFIDRIKKFKNALYVISKGHGMSSAETLLTN